MPRLCSAREAGDTGGMGFFIHDAVGADMAALQDVFRRSSLSNVNDRLSLLEHPDSLEFSDSSLALGRVRVATIATDRPIGFVTSRLAAEALELEDLFVDPDWMRRGVGRALILDVVTFAQAVGVACVEVTGNPHALAFYRQVGFVAVGRTDTEFGIGYRMHLDVPL
jgi:GNAT superfamily N-acetyltransferase